MLMTIMKDTVIILLVYIVFTCAILPVADEKPVDYKEAYTLETLYGFELKNENIVITVMSNGCTKKDDFRLLTSSTLEGYDVSIIRSKPDRCRRMPMLDEIAIALDDSKKTHHFRILNSVKMKP